MFYIKFLNSNSNSYFCLGFGKADKKNLAPNCMAFIDFFNDTTNWVCYLIIVIVTVVIALIIVAVIVIIIESYYYCCYYLLSSHFVLISLDIYRNS